MSSSLAGLKVVDLSRVLGGPFCSQILADHGADVLKIEPPQGDETRKWGPPFRADGMSAYFYGANRRKKFLNLDLQSSEGRETLLQHLEHADVLLENFKPGTLEKWGLGYKAFLQARFPRLIHCRITGFGANGPLGGLPGYDAVAQAWSGWMSLNGTPESGPLRMALPLIDMSSGMYAAIGILMALRERELTGQGQLVETSLYETGLSLLHPHGANWIFSGVTPGQTGSAHPNICPYDLFPTRTCPVFLAVGNDGQFAQLCEELGRPELAKCEDYLHNSNRLKNRDRLRAELVDLLQDKDGHEWAERLLRKGVPAGPVLTVPEALTHPQSLAREMFVEHEGQKIIGSPLKMSR